MLDVRDEYDARSILTATGQQVTATETEVAEYNQSNESPAVRAALPEGRLIAVDFAAPRRSLDPRCQPAFYFPVSAWSRSMRIVSGLVLIAWEALRHSRRQPLP
jgi:hypothetical protein